jgi:hypothetical protein
MQNREEFRQKGHDESRKMTCPERGKKYHFQKGGGGINIVFGPKYRPLLAPLPGLMITIIKINQKVKAVGAKFKIKNENAELLQKAL